MSKRSLNKQKVIHSNLLWGRLSGQEDVRQVLPNFKFHSHHFCPFSVKKKISALLLMMLKRPCLQFSSWNSKKKSWSKVPLRVIANNNVPVLSSAKYIWHALDITCMGELVLGMGLSYKQTGVLAGHFEKNPGLKDAKVLFCRRGLNLFTPKRYQP